MCLAKVWIPYHAEISINLIMNFIEEHRCAMMNTKLQLFWIMGLLITFEFLQLTKHARLGYIDKLTFVFNLLFFI